MAELVTLRPMDEAPEERVVAVLRQALQMAEAGQLRAVALAGVVQHGPADRRGHYSWAGADDAQLRTMLAGHLAVTQAEVVDLIRADLVDAEDE
jgi:hypothetical protein